MPTTRFLGRYDTRSGATLISTGGVLPMPLIGLAWPAVLRPGGLLPLLIVWAFITVIFSYTAWRGYLSDRAFGIVGGCGIVGICATAMVLSGEMARQAVLGLVAVIPTIAAIAVSAFLIWGLLGLAIGGSTSVILATASSGPDALVCVGAMLGTIVVPVFLVVALRRSLARTLNHQTLLTGVDPLTGLLNRRGFFTRATELLAATRVSPGWVGILLIDIDHFKEVNDAYGHVAGDGVLLAAAAALREVAPDGSVVCRFGGEEFLILCVIRDDNELALVAERVRTAVSDTTPVTISVGGVCASLVASNRSVAMSADDVVTRLLRQADQCVYTAKRNGRDTVHIESMDPILWQKPVVRPQPDGAITVPHPLIELFSRHGLDTK